MQVSYVLPNHILPTGQMGNVTLQFSNIACQAIGPNKESYSNDTNNWSVGREPL